MALALSTTTLSCCPCSGNSSTTLTTPTNFIEVPKIRYGLNSSLGEFPFQVHITNRQDYSRCGGAIISNILILTAAHCVFGSNATDFDVVSGDFDLTLAEGTEVLSSVSRVIVHQGYNQSNFDNDIAILVLRVPLKFNVNIKPVDWGGHLGRLTGRNVSVAGWGLTVAMTEDGVMEATASDTLQKIAVPIVDCLKSYNATRITERMICAGDGIRDVCQGDSGSPLVTAIQGKQRVVGIVSWGPRCDFTPRKGLRRPSVYTNVLLFSNWINEIVQTHNNSKCGRNSFYCTGEDKCIPTTKFCDRELDCDDGSDEMEESGCARCKVLEFRCSGGCARGVIPCNGRSECPNGEDEALCTMCRGQTFYCFKSKKCIPLKDKCDRKRDCPEGEDEEDCHLQVRRDGDKFNVDIPKNVDDALNNFASTVGSRLPVTLPPPSVIKEKVEEVVKVIPAPVQTYATEVKKKVESTARDVGRTVSNWFG